MFAHRAGNMAHHLYNEELADMYIVYGAAQGNAKEAVRLF